MELVVAVAIGVLSIIFVGSLIALLLVCRQRYCLHHQLDKKPILKYSKDNLESGASDYNSNEFELDDILQLSPNIEKVLKDNDWIQDATGLVQHCLSILKSCHSVTDKLSGLSFSPVHGDQELMDEVRRATARVMPRVDDLVRAMYNTAGGRKRAQALLLEARATALVLAVNNLLLVFRSAYGTKLTTGAGAAGQMGYPAWLCTALMDMERQLNALREASEMEETQQTERGEFLQTGNVSTKPTGTNDLVSTASV